MSNETKNKRKVSKKNINKSIKQKQMQADVENLLNDISIMSDALLTLEPKILLKNLRNKGIDNFIKFYEDDYPQYNENYLEDMNISCNVETRDESNNILNVNKLPLTTAGSIYRDLTAYKGCISRLGTTFFSADNNIIGIHQIIKARDMLRKVLQEYMLNANLSAGKEELLSFLGEILCSNMLEFRFVIEKDLITAQKVVRGNRVDVEIQRL